MRFQCPNCKEIVSVDNSEMGAQVQCGRCQQVVAVPENRTAPGARTRRNGRRLPVTSDFS